MNWLFGQDVAANGHPGTYTTLTSASGATTFSVPGDPADVNTWPTHNNYNCWHYNSYNSGQSPTGSMSSEGRRS